MSTPDWSSLPSVVLFDLYQFLPFNDRLVASSTCKKWRDAFFLYPNWRKLQFDTVRYKEGKTNFILSKAKKHCRSVSIAYTPRQFVKVVNMLDNWPGNNRVQEVHLLGSGEHNPSTFPTRCQLSIFRFLENCTRLVSLFLSHFSDVDRLCMLLEKHSSCLLYLGIGKLYKNSDTSPKTLKLPLLPNLMVLQLDGKFVTEELLLKCIVRFNKLKRLIFHIRENCEIGRIPQEVWDLFKTLLPQCEIHMTYHRITRTTGYQISCMLTMCSNMTQVRFLYCSGEFQEICMNELMKRSQLVTTVKTIWSIHCDYDDYSLSRHPFVICAWRFQNLKELLFTGAMFELHDIVGILKMRKEVHISIGQDDLVFSGIVNDRIENNKLKRTIKTLSGNQDWEPMPSKRFNDRNLTDLQREVVALREVFKVDFEPIN